MVKKRDARAGKPIASENELLEAAVRRAQSAMLPIAIRTTVVDIRGLVTVRFMLSSSYVEHFSLSRREDIKKSY